MKRALGFLLLAFANFSCAPADPVAPAAAAPPVSVRDEMKTFRAEEDRLLRGGLEAAEDLAHRRRFIGRFRELTRCGNPPEEDRAYGAWALLLANLENAEYEADVGREALPLFREWAERYPDSEELGDSLWMLTDTAPDDESEEVYALLETLSASPSDGVAKGALAARADCLEYFERPEEEKPLLEEVIRRWPDSFEARVARRDLRGMSLTPGVEAPGFSLRDLSGRQVSLASFRGQVTLLYFFSFG